ncbi:MAG: sulfotransferase domain-containing protein [Pseudomonadota bacterium]
MTGDEATARLNASAPVLIASHPRSGTHLLIDTLRRQFALVDCRKPWGVASDHLYVNVERTTSPRRPFDQPTVERILSRSTRALVKTHYTADFGETWSRDETAPLPEFARALVTRCLKIYVHRDPRDVMVSYLQMLASIDDAYRGLSLRAFMESPHWSGETSRLGWWCAHTEQWLARDDVTAIGFADLTRRTRETIETLGTHLGEPPLWAEPLLPPKVETVQGARWHRLFFRSPASTAIVADAERFPAEDWRTALTADDHSWLEAQAGSLMDRLGYKRWQG